MPDSCQPGRKCRRDLKQISGADVPTSIAAVLVPNENLIEYKLLRFCRSSEKNEILHVMHTPILAGRSIVLAFLIVLACALVRA